jgi:hypothetical protein
MSWMIAILMTVGAALWTAFVIYANGMRSSPGEFVGRPSIVFAWIITALMWVIVIAMPSSAHGAYERIPKAPRLVVGEAVSDRLLYGERSYNEHNAPLNLFGVYSRHYMHRRWKRMCKGPERYDAMREAYERGMPQPCQK